MLARSTVGGDGIALVSGFHAAAIVCALAPVAASASASFSSDWCSEKLKRQEAN